LMPEMSSRSCNLSLIPSPLLISIDLSENPGALIIVSGRDPFLSTIDEVL